MSRGERGQASVALLGGVPVRVIAALAVLQLAAVADSLHLADAAAEAGALAVAGDAPPGPAVRAALPDWARGADVAIDEGTVRVSIVPPGPLAALGEALTVSSSAWARPAGG
jgi:hypothetical protein